MRRDLDKLQHDDRILTPAQLNWFIRRGLDTIPSKQQSYYRQIPLATVSKIYPVTTFGDQLSGLLGNGHQWHQVTRQHCIYIVIIMILDVYTYNPHLVPLLDNIYNDFYTW